MPHPPPVKSRSAVLIGRDDDGVFLRIGRSTGNRVYQNTVRLTDIEAAEMGLFAIHLAGLEDRVRYETWPPQKSKPTPMDTLCSCAVGADSSCASS